MIVKGYIEELIPPDQARVRLPEFDGEYGYSTSVDTAELNTATVSTPYGIYPNLNIGDEVYVSFLYNRLRSPIIIGKIYKADDFDNVNQSPDAHLRNLSVLSEVNLPKNLTIGDTITYEDLLKLKNIKDNIQSQLDSLVQPLYENEIECSIENYEGYYDGNYHTCICKTTQPISFLYSEDGNMFQNVPLSYKDAGEHTVYIKAFLGLNFKIYEGHVNITGGKLIKVIWDSSKLIYDGNPKTPEITLNGVEEGDFVEPGEIKYYKYDLDGTTTAMTSVPTEPGVYLAELLNLSGQDADKYQIEATTNMSKYVIDENIKENWGTISDIISTYNGNEQSITIKEV